MADKFSSNKNSLNPSKNLEVSRQLRRWLSLLLGAKGTDLRERNQGHVAASPIEAAGNICRAWHRPAVLAGPVTDPSQDLPSGGRWNRGEDLAPGGPRRTLPSPSPPASHGHRCRRASGLSAAPSPKLFPRPPRHPLGEPVGLGLCSPAGEETKTRLERSGKREFVPQMAQPERCLTAQPGPELLQQHLPGQAGARGTRLPPSTVAQHQVLLHSQYFSTLLLLLTC